ncbi:hypothetical protein DRB17_12545 [Ferruginivarius sediminum]|uniref:Uncharacterized protein n=1 Tax=Ferruginivarius sediminum TaxID=2661937 RepID=A0A369T9H8_9PROT|nr:hypothetical protein DRB17_12545 [Ferruginivarius sediminum]
MLVRIDEDSAYCAEERIISLTTRSGLVLDAHRFDIDREAKMMGSVAEVYGVRDVNRELVIR